MINAGFAKSEVKNITGHSTESGLDPYDSGNEEELYQMSSAISGKKPAPNYMSIVPNNPQIFVPNPSFIPAQCFLQLKLEVFLVSMIVSLNVVKLLPLPPLLFANFNLSIPAFTEWWYHFV